MTNDKLTDNDLLYAATVRCRQCHAGVAYPLDSELAMSIGAWVCAAVLKDEIEVSQSLHDSFPWSLYKIREETSINNQGGHTTRPEGTVAMTVGKATCPVCQTTWESEPYSACGLSHHWFSGPCPKCGYAVAAGGRWSSTEGKPIEHRFRDVVLERAGQEPS